MNKEEMQRRNLSIREDYSKLGLSGKQLSEKYNITREQIRKIISKNLTDLEYKLLKNKSRELRKKLKLEQAYKSGIGYCKQCGKRIDVDTASTLKLRSFCCPEHFYSYSKLSPDIRKQRHRDRMRRYMRKYSNTEKGKDVQRKATKKYYEKKNRNKANICEYGMARKTIQNSSV